MPTRRETPADQRHHTSSTGRRGGDSGSHSRSIATNGQRLYIRDMNSIVRQRLGS
jgi:hypothetical protein